MNVNRRTALKQFLIIAGGTVLLPSCLQEKSKASILLKNVEIDADQEKMLAELSETIIPATDTPGAKDVYAHLFTMKMLDDCTEKEDQKKFLKGMKEFQQLTKDKFKKSFVELTPAQREELLAQIEKGQNINEDVKAFYSLTKRLTIQGYLSSKYFATNVEVYKLVPGPYKGAVPVSSIKTNAGKA